MSERNRQFYGETMSDEPPVPRHELETFISAHVSAGAMGLEVEAASVGVPLSDELKVAYRIFAIEEAELILDLSEFESAQRIDRSDTFKLVLILGLAATQGKPFDQLRRLIKERYVPIEPVAAEIDSAGLDEWLAAYLEYVATKIIRASGEPTLQRAD